MSNIQNPKSDTYVWTFKNVKEIWEDKGTSLMSDRFKMKNVYDTDWRIITNCEKKEAKEQYLSLYIENLKSYGYIRNFILKLRFAMINPFEGQVRSNSKMILDVIPNLKYGFSDFITINQLKELSVQDLTIHCTLEVVQKDLEIYKPFMCSPAFSDVNLIVGDETYPAHKMVLSMSSGLLKKKFGAHDSISSLAINKVKPEIFMELLKFMYTGTVDNMETLASEFFAAATTYQICDLQKKCKEFLKAHLKPENFISTILLCHTKVDFYTSDLYETCMDFVAKNLKTMISSGVCKELGEKDPEFLRDIVKSFRLVKNNVRFVKRMSWVSEESDSSDTYCASFDTFLNNKTLSDVTIHVGDRKFCAHKLILSIRSPVFRKMFQIEMKETILDVVIEDIEADVFYEVLHFMYTDKINNIENIASDVLVAANKYDINELKAELVSILLDNLTIDNVSSILLIADRVSSTKLKSECFHFIAEFAFLSSEFDELLHQLDAHFLLELLSKFDFDHELNLVVDLT